MLGSLCLTARLVASLAFMSGSERARAGGVGAGLAQRPPWPHPGQALPGTTPSGPPGSPAHAAATMCTPRSWEAPRPPPGSFLPLVCSLGCVRAESCLQSCARGHWKARGGGPRRGRTEHKDLTS